MRSAKVDQESRKNFSNYWFSIADRRRQSFEEQGEGKFERELDFRRAPADNNGIGLVQLRRRIRSLDGAT